MGRYGDIARTVLSRKFPLETIDQELSTANVLVEALDMIGEELRFLIEQRNAQHYLSFAYGQGLSLLGADMYSLGLKAASSARVKLQITRTSTTSALTIPKGTLVRDVDSLDKYATDSDIFWEDGKAGMLEVEATNILLGPNNIHKANTIIMWDGGPPEAGVTVTNGDVVAGGNYAESEDDYKIRLGQVFQSLGLATVSAIKLAVGSVPEVKNFFVFVPIDSEGHHFGLTNIIIADESGYGNSSIAALVQNALDTVLAAGEYATIISASPMLLDITLTATWELGMSTIANKNLLEKLVRTKVNSLPPNGGDALSATFYPGLVESIAETYLPVTHITVTTPVGAVAPVQGQVIRAGTIDIQ